MLAKARRRRLAETVAACLASIAIALLLSEWLPFRMIEARIFDQFATAAPPAIADLARRDGAVVIVAIDEPSFAELGLQWPWPRDLHARLIEALRGAGAKAIGLDLIFAEPSTPQADAALATALGPDVVLAADESLIETPQVAQLVRTEPIPEFTANGARTGLASVVLDADGVLRRAPGYANGFAAETLAAAGVVAPEPWRGGLLQPMGPGRTYPTVSYYQALDPDTFLPEGFFDGRIVLVGRSLQAAVTTEAGGIDSFATPVTARTGLLVPGVEVQATLLDNLRYGLSVRWASLAETALFIAAAALAAALLAWRPADLWTLLGAAIAVAGTVAASFLVFETVHLFLPPAGAVVAMAAAVMPLAARDIAEERRQRRAVIRAFGHYLAPAMVERLARDPQALKLGGETRVLTILFSDIRNFTVLAETMKDEPEKLTGLINRLLTPLSEAVLERGGTIDKFIGDCIMAFWNAPLEADDHAPRAVEAGLAMLAALETVNESLAAELGPAAPRLSIGIGINTGTCVVGNMGSEKRFDYSVLGDAVNYAARLESASKPCRVPLLLGAATAERLAGSRLKPLLAARIAVKGRSGIAPVYTVLPDVDLTDDTVAAFDTAVEALIAGLPGPCSEEDASGPHWKAPSLDRLYRIIAEREADDRHRPIVPT